MNIIQSLKELRVIFGKFVLNDKIMFLIILKGESYFKLVLRLVWISMMLGQTNAKMK